jgi:hypothetical protein
MVDINSLMKVPDLKIDIVNSGDFGCDRRKVEVAAGERWVPVLYQHHRLAELCFTVRTH